MMKNILRNYDDELRIFLVSCLRQIDYLSDSKIETAAIEHIAMHLIANDKEKGKLLIDKNAEETRFQQESMIIIYDGQLCITTEVDQGHEFVVEYIGKGTVINAHNFLSNRV